MNLLRKLCAVMASDSGLLSSGVLSMKGAALRRWWLLTLWIPGALTVVAMIWLISDRLTQMQTVRGMSELALDVHARAQQIDEQVDRVLTTMSALSASNKSCTASVFQALAKAVRADRYVYEAALLMPDGSVCSSYGYPLARSVLPHRGAITYYPRREREYWFPGLLTDDVNQDYIVIAQDKAFVWVNKDLFFDGLPSFSSRAYRLIDGRDAHVVMARDDDPIAIGRPPPVGQLVAHKDAWYLALATPWPNVLGVISEPATEVNQTRWLIFLAVLFGSGISSFGLVQVGRYVYRHQLSLAAQLSRAMRHNRLNLHYQPIVDLRTGDWRGAEALLRWSVKGRTLSPAMVVAEAQRCGLTNELTRWICRRVAEEYAAFFQYCDSLYITINLSAEDLADSQFADFVSALFREYHVPAAVIVFELTESVVLDKDAAASQMRRLKELGHRIAVDDFGTGYSNLAYLEHLPIDILKIDRSFLTLDRCHASKAMWRQVLRIAQTMQYSVVAEGVEFTEQAHLLSQAGVTLAQGWLYSPALPARQLALQRAAGSSAL
ncbi:MULTISPECIES: EAL domain-containing protein [unclassified Pseudomonas]|uniref:EAL domain-containing protein n=1 Tax=unclassified Pseudomonas TaxID=196821 RepID=UPI001032F007|nr:MULTISPECIES: EAL domain-containing protein [unclassified Pseudomonas]